jgi:hypothetical protein
VAEERLRGKVGRMGESVRSDADMLGFNAVICWNVVDICIFASE